MAIGAEQAGVTAVIVNYQSYDELRTCLASLNGPCGRLPAVVIDHSSNAEAADELSRAFPDVRLLRVNENNGFAAGVNQGARETDAPLLLLLNPDCVLEPGAGGDWLPASISMRIPLSPAHASATRTAAFSNRRADFRISRPQLLAAVRG